MRSEAKGLGSAEFQPQSQITRSLEHKWHYWVGLLEAETRNSGFCISIGPLSSHSLAFHSLEVGKNLLGISGQDVYIQPGAIPRRLYDLLAADLNSIWVMNSLWSTRDLSGRTIIINSIHFCNLYYNSVQFSHSVVSDSATHGLQHATPPCVSPTPGVYSNSGPLSGWCHPTISSSVGPFSSHLQSFPAPGSFPLSQFFVSSAQGIGAPASASILPMNAQDWSPLGWTGCISLQSKGLSRVFSNTTVQKHQFFSTQLSL